MRKIYWEFLKLHIWEAVLFLIIVIHIILLLHINFFPYPELFVYSFLTSKGMLAYKDIFDQHFPGIMLFPLNLYSLGLATFPAMRVIHLALIAINQVILFIIGKKIFGSSKKAILVNVLYLVWQPYFEGNVLWIESFITPLILLSYYFLEEKKKVSYFTGGFLLGIALFFKQVLIPLILAVFLYLFFIRKIAGKIYYFLGGFLVVPLLMTIYILRAGIFKEFFYWTVTFNLTTFSQMGTKHPNLRGIISALPFFGVGLLAIFVIFLIFKKKYLLLLITSIFSLFFAYARYDFIHLQPAIPFFILLMTILFFELKSRYRVQLLFLYFAVSFVFVIRFYRSNWGNNIAFYGSREKTVAKIIKDNTTQDDKIFSYGFIPNIYYLSDRLPAGNKFVFQFPWFMKVAHGEILKGIIQDSPKLVIREKGITTDGESIDNYMKDIDGYINENYAKFDQVDGVEILKKI